AHHKQLQVWAESCPEHFENRAALVGAEIARLEGRDVEAMRLYEHAIRSAHDNGFVENEAIACERAAEFYRGRGFDRIADLYLSNPRHAHGRAGADGKARQPEEEATPAEEQLDLATVIKVSQAVSGTIVREKLLVILMRTALEQAGAGRGLLVLARGMEQRIAAEATTSGDTLGVEFRDEPVSPAALPQSILNHALSTGEGVLLDDATVENAFVGDPYLEQHQARSVLCLPLIHQAQRIGALYLENNLAPRVFTPGRITVLKLLASQAAIALENTRLYRDLAEREAKIRRLVEADIIGIFICDSEGAIFEANDAFLRLVGYDREDVTAGRLRWTDLTPPEWRERDVRLLREHRKTGLLKPFEKEYFRKDGSRVPVLVGAASFEGRRNEAVAFVLDLSDRKQAEQELRASEIRFRTFVDNATEGFMVYDERGVILDANRNACESLGYSRDEVIGMVPEDVNPDATPPYKRAMQKRLDAGEIVTFEGRLRRKDGTMFPIEARLRQFRQADRRLSISLVRDITERKRAEEEARESGRRYREMRIELEHASRLATLGQLTASISHEVSQPIAGTIGNAQAALLWLDRASPDLEEIRQALDRIVRDGFRARDVTRRLRDLIKKAPPRRELLEINEAIREVVELTRGETAKNGVRVQTDLADGLPPIEGDRVQLQQVMLNLVINAVEAMSGTSDGPRDLQISTRKNESGEVLVAVRDSGPGLAPVALERLFDAFYTTKTTGLGLGLSICRSIIESHGGQLWASANQPRGAVFQCTVPAHPGDAP
ncbi:MAG TPA: PAS domain S-box protein, partial [Burkholderiales bacterium]|nr:PAS domain S-box protein [Burkholderiales bacterium]